MGSRIQGDTGGYRDTEIQGYRDKIMHGYSGIHRDTEIQIYRYIGIRGYRDNGYRGIKNIEEYSGIKRGNGYRL